MSDTVLSVATSTAKSAYSTAAVRLPKKGGRRSKRHKAMVEVPNFDFREIEKRVGSIFNVALIDCEGCIKHIAATGILDQVHLILLEADRTKFVNYEKWYRHLLNRGFANVWMSQDTLDLALAADGATGPGAVHEFSRATQHSAWVRLSSDEGRRGPLEDKCLEHKRRLNYRPHELTCLPLKSNNTRVH